MLYKNEFKENLISVFFNSSGHRTFQSVVDLVSDSSNQNCVPGTRDCIPHQGPEEGQKQTEAPNIGASGAQAKTDESSATNATEALPEESKATALDSGEKSVTVFPFNQIPMYVTVAMCVH